MSRKRSKKQKKSIHRKRIENSIRETRKKENIRKATLPQFYDDYFVYQLSNDEYLAINTEAEEEEQLFHSVESIDDATIFDLVTASEFQKSLLEYKGHLFIYNHRQFIPCVRRYTCSMSITNEHELSVTSEHPSIKALTQDVGDAE